MIDVKGAGREKGYPAMVWQVRTEATWEVPRRGRRASTASTSRWTLAARRASWRCFFSHREKEKERYGTPETRIRQATIRSSRASATMALACPPEFTDLAAAKRSEHPVVVQGDDVGGLDEGASEKPTAVLADVPPVVPVP